jgi:hypothetical protein
MKMVHLFLLFFILIALRLGDKSYPLDSSRICEKAGKKSIEQPQDSRGSGRRNYRLIIHRVA